MKVFKFFIPALVLLTRVTSGSQLVRVNVPLQRIMQPSNVRADRQ